MKFEKYDIAFDLENEEIVTITGVRNDGFVRYAGKESRAEKYVAPCRFVKLRISFIDNGMARPIILLQYEDNFKQKKEKNLPEPSGLSLDDLDAEVMAKRQSATKKRGRPRKIL